jgi:hypothetical protein
MLVNGNEPFVFPSQVQQVFYFDDFSNPWWKVILHKESRNKRVFLDTYGEYISTNEYGSVLDAQGQCQMHQPFQVMFVQYSPLRRSHYYSMNQFNLALKNNPKEEMIGLRRLFQ